MMRIVGVSEPRIEWDERVASELPDGCDALADSWRVICDDGKRATFETRELAEEYVRMKSAGFPQGEMSRTLPPECDIEERREPERSDGRIPARTSDRSVAELIADGGGWTRKELGAAICHDVEARMTYDLVNGDGAYARDSATPGVALARACDVRQVSESGAVHENEKERKP